MNKNRPEVAATSESLASTTSAWKWHLASWARDEGHMASIMACVSALVADVSVHSGAENQHHFLRSTRWAQLDFLGFTGNGTGGYCSWSVAAAVAAAPAAGAAAAAGAAGSPNGRCSLCL